MAKRVINSKTSSFANWLVRAKNYIAMNFSQCSKSGVVNLLPSYKCITKISILTVISVFFLFVKVSHSENIQLCFYTIQYLAKVMLFCNKSSTTIFILILHIWNQLLYWKQLVWSAQFTKQIKKYPRTNIQFLLYIVLNS